MKFLTEKKKLFALIAMICFALAFATNLLFSGSIFSYFSYMFESFGQFLLCSTYILISLVALLLPLCYAGAAFFVWKKDDHMKLLGVSGAIVIINIVLGIMAQILSFIVYDYFHFATLLTSILSNFLPLVFAAYLITFSFIKMKGPVVPIIGAALAALLFGSSLLSFAAIFIEGIVRLFDYFSWSYVWSLIKSLISAGISSVSMIGLLLLVPVAFYIPKDEAAEEVVAHAEAEAVEEIPVVEEIPAAE